MSLRLAGLRYSSACHSIPVTQVFKKVPLNSGLLIRRVVDLTAASLRLGRHQAAVANQGINLTVIVRSARGCSHGSPLRTGNWVAQPSEPLDAMVVTNDAFKLMRD